MQIYKRSFILLLFLLQLLHQQPWSTCSFLTRVAAQRWSSQIRSAPLRNRTGTGLVLTEKQSSRQEDEAGGVQQRRHAEPKVRPPDPQVSASVLNSRVSVFFRRKRRRRKNDDWLHWVLLLQLQRFLRSESLRCCSSAERRRKRMRRKVYSRVPDELRCSALTNWLTFSWISAGCSSHFRFFSPPYLSVSDTMENYYIQKASKFEPKTQKFSGEEKKRKKLKIG